MTRIRRAMHNGSLDQAPYYYNIARAWGHLTTPDEPKARLMQGVVESEEFTAKTCHGLVGIVPGRDGNRRFQMMDRPDPAFYDVETLCAAGRAHLRSESITDDMRHRIAAVVSGCEDLLSNADQPGTD